jgi:chemotaxis protein MotA
VDVATIIGVLAGFTLVILAVASGRGGGAEFFHVPSVMIVIGGMFSATLIHFSLGQVLRIASVVKKTLFCKLPHEQDLIQKMVNYSAISRRDGALVLERQLPEVDEPFLVKGLQMVVDGQNEDQVNEQLSMEIEHLQGPPPLPSA